MRAEFVVEQVHAGRMRRPLGGPPRPRACDANACGPTGVHDPVTDEQARCGLGVQLQPTVDGARRLLHEQGLRPYRVFLVWQEREHGREWQTVRELELVPVKAIGMHEIELTVTPVGTLPTGASSCVASQAMHTCKLTP